MLLFDRFSQLILNSCPHFIICLHKNGFRYLDPKSSDHSGLPADLAVPTVAF